MTFRFDTGLEHHRAGRLEQAERIYAQILADNPQHADALHLLGVIAHQRGDHQQGEERIRQAIALAPDVAAYHNNLAEILRVTGRTEETLVHARRALQLQPDFAEAHNNLALALHEQRELQAAEEHLRTALQLNPRYAMAHNNLGNLLRDSGRFDEALQAFRAALQCDQDLVLAHSNLGQLLLERDELADALTHCQRAARLAPRFAEGHNNLGNVLRAWRRLDEAKACYQQALNLNPSLALSYNNMAQALQEEGKIPEAIDWYQKALQLDPQSARIHTNLASALADQEQWQEAIGRYRQAILCDAGYAEAHNGLGYVLLEQGNYQEARACFEEAMRLRDDLSAAVVNFARLRAELGDLDEVVPLCRQALACRPRNAGAYHRLAATLRGDLPDNDVVAIEQLLKQEYLSEGERSSLYFALADVFDGRRQYERAAEHLQVANELQKVARQRQGKSYERAEHSRFVDQIIECFNSDYSARVRSWGNDARRPVFIVGLPRSGTTLTEQILASHPDVFGAGELSYVREIFESLPAVTAAAQEPLACLPELRQEHVRQLAEQHLRRLGGLGGNAKRVTDKMPDNYLYLGLIVTLFPRARIIHCRRDLRDVALSCWRTSFGAIRWASDLQDIAARFADYQRLMDHWERTLPVGVLEVNYEETVADPESAARRLVSHVDLDWHPACSAPHEHQRPIRTASLIQVRQPVYSHSVGRCQHYERVLESLILQLHL